MSAHTPGPWIASFANRSIDVFYQPAYVVAGDRSIRVSDDPSGDADARLIAAAPDLLEALLGMLGAANASVATGRPFVADLQCIGTARAAIAKATVTPCPGCREDLAGHLICCQVKP